MLNVKKMLYLNNQSAREKVSGLTGSINSIELSALLSNISIFFSVMTFEEQLMDVKNVYNKQCSLSQVSQ